MQPDTTKKVRHQFPQSDPKMGGASSSPQNSLSPKVASKCSLHPLGTADGWEGMGKGGRGCVSKRECQSSFFPGLGSPAVQGTDSATRLPSNCPTPVERGVNSSIHQCAAVRFRPRASPGCQLHGKSPPPCRPRARPLQARPVRPITGAA